MSESSSPTSESTSDDERFMRIALEEARHGEGRVEPNPMVGCVLVRDGEVIGRGHHTRFGQPHAEVEAIRSLGSAADAQGTTAYVTLEPCCHHGKTPPCSKALIDAGVARVVVAQQDPFPQVDGGGLQQLTAAGIDVVTGVLADDASDLLAPYLKTVHQKRPWVIAKWAMTVDGRIATVTGESQWITGEGARAEVHKLRGRVDAIAVGMGTVEADDPLLTARPTGDRQATRIVFCSHRLPGAESKLIQTASETPVLLVVSSTIDESAVKPLADLVANVFRCPGDDRTEMVDAVLDHLGELGMTNVMLEGGGELLGSFSEADQLDECHVYVGAKLFGGASAPGPIAGAGIAKVADANSLRLHRINRFDDDLRLVYRRAQ